MLSPEDRAVIRAWLDDIAAGMDEAAAETRRLAQLRCDILRMVRDRSGMTYDALGALAGVSAARAGDLARNGDPARFTA